MVKSSNRVQASFEALTAKTIAQLLMHGRFPLPHNNYAGWRYSVQKDLSLRKQNTSTCAVCDVDFAEEVAFKDVVCCFFNQIVVSKDISVPFWA